ncbi:MAG TPA: type IV pili methyl-accepting chemotaxis transducer N-terminal domain-containing protein, partial [Acinetobacter sp.]|nr:type IV pili methyl-accepting chemotaxis transducer N-terminal domain-containing protein [Acinetobacter sp.]
MPLYAWAAALTISILCCLSALGGGMLAWVSEADAQAIDTAGSIRMAAYQINFQLATNFAVNLPFDLNTDATNHQNKAISESNSINQPTSQKVTILIEDMENRLAKLDAYQLTNANDSQAIDSQLTQIHRQWLDSLKPALMSQDKQKFYIDSIDYIKKVDR